MPTGAAGDDLDVAKITEFVLADLHLIEVNLAGLLGDAAQHGVPDRSRLLENLLKHEMFEAALFGGDGVPGDVMDFRLDRIGVDVADLDAFRGEDGDVSVGKEKDVASVRQDTGNITGHEVFVLAQADHNRRAIAGRDDFARVLGREDDQSVDPDQTLGGFAHGVFERAAVHVFLHQVRHDLRIGLRDELVSFFLQFLLELQIVFDDSVVDHDDFALAVAVWVRIFLRRPAMCGPARVAQAVDAINGVVANGLLKIRQLARSAADFHLAVFADHSDARRIVSAIFQAAKAV